MADVTKKPNTIKSIGKKVANNGDASDYEYIPIGADSDNVDRPDGSTVEESLSNIEIEKVEIIPVESLPVTDIKIYPFIYALVKPRESKGTFYEYKNNQWIKYGNSSTGLWVGTKEECAKDFDNIENGTIVIIINKKEDSGETHSHDYVYEITKPPTYSETGIKKCTCFLCGHSYTENIPALIDSINPAGVIRIGDNEYVTWKDTITFDTYYKDNQTVTIEATDNETGVKEIAYHLATTGISDSNIETVNWTVYDGAFEITPNNNYIIYARITDNADNVTYICSDGIVMDNIPPVFEDLEDGGTYPTGTVLTVEEGATLTVNGEIVELVDNTYTFTEVMDNCILSITDRAGNSSSISITINIHEHIFVDGICSICGSSEELNDWEYSIDETSKTISLTKYKGDNENVFVKQKYVSNGIEYNTMLNSVGFVSPFEEKSELITSINIENGVKSNNIKYMFSNLTNITELDLSGMDLSNIDNSDGTFSEDSILEKVILPSSLAILGESCFCRCNSLISIGSVGSNSSLEIPNSVTIIGENCFEYCTNLTTVDFPEGIEIIGDSFLRNSRNVERLTIPSTVTNIGSKSDNLAGGMFGRLSNGEYNNLKMVYYNTEAGEVGTLVNAASKDGMCVYFGENVLNIPNIFSQSTDGSGLTKISNVTDIVILGNVVEVPKNLCMDEINLKNVTLPDSIISIENQAFKNCTNLTSINFPNSLEFIKIGVFYECINLKSINLPDSLKQIWGSAFRDCTNLIATIPDTVELIVDDSFKNVKHIYYNGTASGAPWGALAIN